MNKWKINRCYDSHAHLLGTGIFQAGLRLFHMQSVADLASISLQPQYFRGEWLVGFGWDHNKWSGGKFPTRQDLDLFFPNFPVVLTRADGHAVWLNTKALEMTGYLNPNKPSPVGGIIPRDSQGIPTGIFLELAKIDIDRQMPVYSEQQTKEQLVEAVEYFNRRGFTHVRDMSGFAQQWEILRQMDLSGELSIYLDQNFTCENLEDFEGALKMAKFARGEQTPHLRSRGIKFYFDGALGSQGAFISQFYAGTDNKGITLWPLDHVEKVIERTWGKDLEVSIHAIGDEAADMIVEAVLRVQKRTGLRGLLNLEHAELLRPETIQKIAQLNSKVHMQPCHWLTDSRWLYEKLPELSKYAFPWRALQEKAVPLQWGSDSPIEEASVSDNYRALCESAKRHIPEFVGDKLAPHSHLDSTWGADCWTEFVDGQPSKVVFDGRPL